MGAPKWMVYNGKYHLYIGIYSGTPISGNPHIFLCKIIHGNSQFMIELLIPLETPQFESVDDPWRSLMNLGPGALDFSAMQ